MPSIVTVAPVAMSVVASIDSDDRGNAELSGDDGGVAHHGAVLDDHARGAEEERRPRRVGLGCDEDLVGFEVTRRVRVEDHPGATRDDAGADAQPLNSRRRPARA